MNDSVIIWDIETIPDLQGFAAANYLVGKTDAEIREVMGDKFPKHIYHSIVCIGALVANREDDNWAVRAMSAYDPKRTHCTPSSEYCEPLLFRS
jgi:predicted PolB exonuclease-like 3'-5' exonuclease